jgi:L-seryl-tRNA(Ser) seleniumtransferase
MTELSRLPKVQRVVDAQELDRARLALGQRSVTELARRVIAECRRLVRAGESPPDEREIVARVVRAAEARLSRRLERVINATGVVLHTNLGRAPLPTASLARLGELCAGYLNLELDVELGRRARRGASAEATMAELVGAEAALIVNNNAAAVLLSLSGLAAGREVIVSRGELVEIGGGFRIPEILARSGAALVEVGTTNRTRIEDYARAMSERTGLILRVHPSNFKITGFSERPPLGSLARLARSRGVPLVKDLGGGLIVELAASVGLAATLEAEPTVQRCLQAGADLVCFSLDKLFGGPQGGVIVGSGELVQRLRSDPLARALRVGKLTLAALEPVLDAYAQGDLETIVVHALLRVPLERLVERVEGWRARLGTRARHAALVRTDAAVGGGTLAEAPLPSAALGLKSASPDALAEALRRARPAVLGRIAGDVLLLDARTVLPDEDEALLRALHAVLPA